MKNRIKDLIYSYLGKAIELKDQIFYYLRRIMPYIAAIFIPLFIAQIFLNRFGGFFYRTLLIKPYFEITTFLFCLIVIVYYGLKILRWLKNRLFWRVRHRLAVTYLFIGLTPILLFILFGSFYLIFQSLERYSGLVVVQMKGTEEDVMANAQIIADAIASLPVPVQNMEFQIWLDEHNRSIQPILPGLKVAVWIGSNGKDTASFSSEFNSEKTEGVGFDKTPITTPLPDWLLDKTEWKGLVYFPESEKEGVMFGTPSFRALVRRQMNDGSPMVVMLVMPINRALVERYSKIANVKVHPYFRRYVALPSDNPSPTPNAVKPKPPNEETSKLDNKKFDRNIDQFGEYMARPQRGPVSYPGTNWLSGESTTSYKERTVFYVIPSRQQIARQPLGDSLSSQVLLRFFSKLGNILIGMEILAVLLALWMTRAVTGTVHKLHRGIAHIKSGDFSYRIKVNSRDQLGELANAFNDMSANIESLLKERTEHERLEREIEIAAEVQSQLFPRNTPQSESIELAGECRAAKGVAGDYYDYIQIEPALILAALGDVSGKGISASLVMSNLQAAVRAQAEILAARLQLVETVHSSMPNIRIEGFSSGTTTRTILPSNALSTMATEINKQLCQSTDTNRFATLFLACYDETSGRLHYTNAGHNAAILVKANNGIERLSLGGMMVGAFDWVSYEESWTAFEPGDLLIVFSDGISEAQNEDGEEYSEERLVELVLKHKDLSTVEIKQAIFEEIDRWSNSIERGDDQTLVVIKAYK
jgi:phosphoserine phosphatase RsbU/P